MPIRPLLHSKARAIRLLNYDSSTKVLAVAARRFWESEDGIYGGGTFTDLPIGTAYYPSDNAQAKDPRVSSGPGVLLASYSWGPSFVELLLWRGCEPVRRRRSKLKRAYTQQAG